VDDQQDLTRAAGLPRAANGPGNEQRRRDIIVIGGSAGALDAILNIAGAFPQEFTGSIFVVSHIGANRSHLPELLTSAGSLPAVHPEDGEPIRPGRIYVAPPDRHMLVTPDGIRLWRGSRQHFTRPAVDPLFRSAAQAFGARVIGVVLSGTGSDGAAGLEKIREAGGVTVVQAPGDTLYPEMPRSALAAISVEHIAARAELPALLRRLSSEKGAMKDPPISRQTSTELDELERPVALTCPECGGALREVEGTAVKQYRCHTGHGFGAEEVLDGQIEEVDHALGVALRVLNERIELCRRMTEDARAGGRSLGLAHWDRLKHEAEEQFQVLQQFLAQSPTRAANEGAEVIPELTQA
jgi:two-component system, chemotaxis family, protein-glutamate methylesterase/glutaminase